MLKKKVEELRRGDGHVTDADARVEPTETQRYIHHWLLRLRLTVTLPLSDEFYGFLCV